MTKTILVTGARAPSALHLARVFHSAGHRVILADTFRYPMSLMTRIVLTQRRQGAEAQSARHEPGSRRRQSAHSYFR